MEKKTFTADALILHLEKEEGEEPRKSRKREEEQGPIA